MDEAHKELVKRLTATRTQRDLNWNDVTYPINPDGEEAALALEALAGEAARIRVALDIEHDDLNPVTMAETWVNKARVLDDQVVSLLAERDRLKAALEPFARFAKMFAEAREHKQGHVPVEPNAEWYARETKQGVYVLTPGMFDEALRALGDAS